MHKEVGIYFVLPAKQGQQVKCQGKFMIRILWIAIANVKCATGDGNVNKWNNNEGDLVGGGKRYFSRAWKLELEQMKLQTLYCRISKDIIQRMRKICSHWKYWTKHSDSAVFFLILTNCQRYYTFHHKRKGMLSFH